MASTSSPPGSSPPFSPRTLEFKVRRMLDMNDPSYLLSLLLHLSDSDTDLQSETRAVFDYAAEFHSYAFCCCLLYVLTNSTDFTFYGNPAHQILSKIIADSSSYPEFLKAILLDSLEDDEDEDGEGDGDGDGDEDEDLRNFASNLVPENLNSFELKELVIPVVIGSLSDLDCKRTHNGCLMILRKLILSELREELADESDFLRVCLKQFLTPETPLGVKSAAVMASLSFIVYMLRGEDDESFKVQELFRHVIFTVFSLTEKQIMFKESEEGYARVVVREMIELVKSRVGVLKFHTGSVLEFVLQIMENSALEEETRDLGMKFLLTLGKKVHRSHQWIWHELVLRIKRVLSLILPMLETVDDNQESESAVFARGIEWLTEFALAIEGKFLLENSKMAIKSYLGSEAWRRRYAVVNALSAIAETSKALKNNLDLAVEPVMKALEDVHHLVRYAAINAVEVLSMNFSPEFQQQYHKTVLPALARAVNDFQNPSIQVQSAWTMSHFSQNCTSNILIPYLDEVLSKLLRCLQSGKETLKVGVLAAIGSLAGSSQDQFQKHYGTVMPYLQVLMSKAKEESNHEILAVSLKCITMVWMAVGKEKFSDDIKPVEQVLISSQSSTMETEDPMRIEVLDVWGRLCKCLGRGFQAYMGIAIPHLLQSAKLEDHATLHKDSNVEDSDERVKTQNLGDVLEEKATACNVLYVCAAELKEDFDLWIDEVARTLVPLLNFHIHEEVRIAAASAMPVLLRSFKVAIEKGQLQRYEKSPFGNLCSYVVPALVEAVQVEIWMDICAKSLNSLNECMELSGPILNTEQIKRFLDVIMEVIKDSSSPPVNKLEFAKKEKVYNKACGCLTTFIKTYNASLSQFFGQILSTMAYMWDKDKTARERRMALHIFSIVAEQCLEEAFKYCGNNVRTLFKACEDQDPEVLQAVAKGIGVCAEFGGSVFRPLVKEALCGLNSVILHQKAMEKDYMQAHNAAVSALGKICHFHLDAVNAAEVFSSWLKHLPIKSDFDEAKVAHHQLCSTVEKCFKKLHVLEISSLCKIFAVYAEILWAGETLATEATVKQMIDQLKRFKKNFASNKWESVLSSLEFYQQNFLIRYVLSS